MDPFFKPGEIGPFEGGVALGESPRGYWYGQGRSLEIPSIGVVNLPRDLVRPLLRPVFPGIFSHCSDGSYQCGFLWALKAYQEGDNLSAFLFFQEGQDSPQVAAMMGFLMLLQGKMRGAIPFLEMALLELKDDEGLGAFLRELGVIPYITFTYPPGIRMGVSVTPRGVRALLARLYRSIGALAASREILERLAMGGGDPLLLLELVELLYHDGEYDRVVELLQDLDNETPVDSALLYYLAMSLEASGVSRLALVAYSDALRKRRGRDPLLLRRIRYRRALLYERMGKRGRYRQEMARLWREDRHFLDVGERMTGLF